MISMNIHEYIGNEQWEKATTVYSRGPVYPSRGRIRAGTALSRIDRLTHPPLASDVSLAPVEHLLATLEAAVPGRRQ